MQNKRRKAAKTEKRNERSEAIRAYFVRLFGKYDFRNERQFLYFGKWLIFILLLLVESLAVLEHIDGFRTNGGWGVFLGLLGTVCLLSLSMAAQLFAVKGKGRIVFYVADVVAACAFLYVAGGVYPLAVYMLVLTQFYFEAERPRQSMLLLIFSILLYMLAYALELYVLHGGAGWSILQLLNLTVGFIVAVIAHFLVTQIALAFYRQYLKLHKTLGELAESKKELEKAYAVVAEVSALEERQRIAKDIHDTAGHSLTTVIMQTEAAKRILDTSPAEAKQKLIAANLQARHALEELRNSVHLLSGSVENSPLQEELLKIIHETTDGTGIVIRSEIDEITLRPAKRRFLCNTLKEGISNGLRHGNATAFWFALKQEGDTIRFLLTDNGKGTKRGGFQKGFGLQTMEERARALGGEVEFLSDLEEGFEIALRLPADGEEKE